MSIPALDNVLDVSVLDPDTITSSSTPRLFKHPLPTRASPTKIAVNDSAKMSDIIVDRPAYDEVESAYTIHLSAVGSASGSSTLNLDQEITRLESEDVGGPSDFTLNLADWINGMSSSHARDNPDADKAMYARDDTTMQRGNNDDHKSPHGARASVLGDITSAGVNDDIPQRPNEHEHCDELLRKNAELSKSLELHRMALVKLKQANTLKDAMYEKELKQLRQQLAVWDGGATRSLADSTTLGLQHESASAAQDPVGTAMQRASAALRDQQRRIEELESRLEIQRDDHLTSVSRIEKERESWEAKENRRTQRIEELERTAGDLRQRLNGTMPANKGSDETRQLQRQLDKQLAAAEGRHKAELEAMRIEHQHVAADVDEWVVKRIEEKDERHAASLAEKDSKITELKARNAKLERISALCGKELMLAWGREECGVVNPGEKQPYRYRHIVHSKA